MFIATRDLNIFTVDVFVLSNGHGGPFIMKYIFKKVCGVVIWASLKLTFIAIIPFINYFWD